MVALRTASVRSRTDANCVSRPFSIPAPKSPPPRSGLPVPRGNHQAFLHVEHLFEVLFRILLRFFGCLIPFLPPKRFLSKKRMDARRGAGFQ